MIKSLSLLIKHFGIFTLIRFIFYPIILLFWGPYRLIVTLWNSRILAKGKWSDYISFGVPQSLNQLFYRTQIINIDRYGRNGISPYLSLGNYHLGYWWHLSLPASYIYYAMGAVLPIFSLFGWLFMHSFWLIDPNTDINYFFLVIILVTFSSTFFANTFVIQNYNSLGWILFPLAMWALHNEFIFLLPLIWLIISLGSITVVLMGFLLSLVIAINDQNFLIFFTFIPVIIKILFHFYWSLSLDSKTNNAPGLKKSLIRTVKSIGISSIGVKYKRVSSKSVSKTFILFLLIYLQFGIIVFYLDESSAIIWTAGILIFIINNLAIRFADVQSIHMLMISVATYLAITVTSPLLIMSFWLVISPPPYVLNDRVSNSPIDLPSPLSPFNIQKIIEKVEFFLRTINQNDRVLFTFDNPNGNYENVFDGYRSLLEVPLYVATKRKFLLIPSWWAVFENNFEGAKDFWGREIEKVNENVEKFNANYVITYNQESSDIDSFISNGYSPISEIDWSNLSDELLDEAVWQSKTPPKWILYKVVNNLKV